MSGGGPMSGFQGLNETQRKKLPAWIRAGLEKMETDKMKKEQDEERKKRTEEKKRLMRYQAAEEMKRDKGNPAHSKFDNNASDEENTDGEEIVPKEVKKSRFHQENGTPSRELKVEEERVVETPPIVEVVKSKEEILQEMSANIRRLMTVLLLEVTAEEIEEISESVITKAKSRTTGKPGLKTMLSGYGSYSDSDTDSSEGDSDDELKTTLKKKKKQFVNTESNILDFCEEEISAYKLREKKWLASSKAGSRTSRSSSPSPTRRGSSRDTKGGVSSRESSKARDDRHRGSREKARNHNSDSPKRREDREGKGSNGAAENSSKAKDARSPSPPEKDERKLNRSRSRSGSKRKKGRKRSKSKEKRNSRRSRSRSVSVRLKRSKRSRSRSKSKKTSTSI